jgi:hypothetical protein
MLRMHICLISMTEIWSKEICTINRASFVILEGLKRDFCKESVSPSTNRKYLACKRGVFHKISPSLLLPSCISMLHNLRFYVICNGCAFPLSTCIFLAF